MSALRDLEVLEVSVGTNSRLGCKDNTAALLLKPFPTPDALPLSYTGPSLYQTAVKDAPLVARWPPGPVDHVRTLG